MNAALWLIYRFGVPDALIGDPGRRPATPRKLA